MNRNLFAIITTLLFVACDPQSQTQEGASAAKDGAAKAGAAPAKSDVVDPAAKAGAADDAGGAAAGTLSSCLDTCDDARTTPTDRATCRLNCDTVYRPKLPGSTAAPEGRADPVSEAASCLSGCYTTAAPDTCAAACKATAVAAPVAPAAAVLDALATCIGTCHADKKALPTNRATCELNCAQTAHIAGPAQPAPVAGPAQPTPPL
jgi:hypothetical protein